MLAGYLADLKYLKPGLAGVLVFVGSKMLLVDIYKVPALASLAVIITILAVAFGASAIARRREQAMEERDGAGLQIPAALSEEPNQ